MQEVLTAQQNRIWSVCCSAPIYPDTDICSGCGEHCAADTFCTDCEGTGEQEILDQSKINCRTISPPYKTVKCETCKGEGIVEAEIEL